MRGKKSNGAWRERATRGGNHTLKIPFRREKNNGEDAPREIKKKKEYVGEGGMGSSPNGKRKSKRGDATKLC